MRGWTESGHQTEVQWHNNEEISLYMTDIMYDISDHCDGLH